MRIVAGLMAMCVLVACGADGAPLRPAPPVIDAQASFGVRL